MATFFVCNVGLVKLLDQLRSAWGVLKMGCVKQAFVPAASDTLADYLPIECDFPGYARIDLTGWTAAALNGSGTAITLADIVTFTRSVTGAPQSAYGVFVVGQDGTLRWAIPDPAGPKAMTVAGDAYAVFPYFRLREPA